MKPHIHQGHAKRSEPWTLTEAKAKFSSLVDRALNGEPQRVVRNGREEVVILDATTFKLITRPKQRLTQLFSALRDADLEFDRPQNDSREVPTF